MAEQSQKSVKTKSIYGPCALVFCSTKTGTWRIQRPKIDDEKCVCCGICAKHCPTAVVTTRKNQLWRKE